MGIEYEAKLIVGLPYEELESFLDGGDPEDFGFEYASPYYDAPCEEWVVGIKVQSSGDYSWASVDEALIQFAHDEFLDHTGMTGRLILSPHGS